MRPDHAGVSGGELLGRDALAELVRRRCGVTVRPEGVSDWLAGEAPGAAEVVEEMGDRLASLLATLRAPATADAAGGARRTYLEVWRGIDLVRVGGGLAKGPVGKRVAAGAGTGVVAARHPEWLPLIGAARSTRGRDRHALVMDAGQTWVKLGIAEYRDQWLAGLRILDPLPVASLTSADLPALLAREVAAARQAHPCAGAGVVCSVASYLEDGRPIREVRSIYEGLDPALMRSGFGVSMRFIHDGTAAWRAAATEERSAVVMLGTWLGVGIGPHREPLRPLAPDFAVDAGG